MTHSTVDESPQLDESSSLNDGSLRELVRRGRKGAVIKVTEFCCEFSRSETMGLRNVNKHTECMRPFKRNLAENCSASFPKFYCLPCTSLSLRLTCFLFRRLKISLFTKAKDKLYFVGLYYVVNIEWFQINVFGLLDTHRDITKKSRT